MQRKKYFMIIIRSSSTSPISIDSRVKMKGCFSTLQARERERDRERQRETERQTETDIQTERDRERHTET